MAHDLPPNPAPNACAGLRRALLHDWQTAFPIEPSPFQTLVRRYGGSPREMLLHCQALRDEGATNGLRTRWRPTLAHASARLLAHAGTLPAAPPSEVLALPGVMAWHVVEGPGLGSATLRGWVDLSALDTAALQQQVEAVRRALPAVGWCDWSAGLAPDAAEAVPERQASLAPGVACRCGRAEGPCRSRPLAAACERGLPVVAHPYRAVGQDLGLSEREVVQALRRWRSAGQLVGVGFTEPVPTSPVLEWHAAYDGKALAPALRDALCAHPGVERLVTAPARGAAAVGEPAALARLVTPGGATAARLGEQLRQAGLGSGLLGVLQVRRLTVRHEPRLFEPLAAAALAN